MSVAFAGGRLWVVSTEGALFSYDAELTTFRAHPLSPRITQVVGGGTYAHPIEDFGGVGIHHLDGEGNEPWPPTLIKEDPRIVLGGYNSIGVLGAHHVVFLEQPEKKLPIAIPGEVTAAAMDANGDLFLATREGQTKGHVQKFRNRWAGSGESGPDFQQPIVQTSPVNAMAKDATGVSCVWAAHANGVDRICAWPKDDALFFPLEDDAKVTALAASARTVLALGERVHLFNETRRTLELPPAVPICGVEVVALDEFLIFPTSAKDAPRYLVVAKPGA